MTGEKVAVITLGCPKNEVDSEVMLGSLAREGYLLTGDLAEAQTAVVNTCGFIKEAKEESLRAILRVAGLKKRGGLARLVVAGCLSQRYQGELASLLPEVDLFVGVNQLSLLGRLLKENARGQHFVSVAEGDSWRLRRRGRQVPYAYVKVAEGCSAGCSFCSIPGIRGPLRSRLLEDVVAEVGHLAGLGVKEIILVAQDLTSYGRDFHEGVTLAELVKQVAAIEGPAWIRLLYLYPGHLTPELVSTIAREEKVVNYLDIPLQHVEGAILKRMKRPGNYHQLLSLCEGLRRDIPGVALRTAFMVGFPGEEEPHFCRLLEFVKEVKFEALGAFKYSNEEGTEAYKFRPQVPERVKARRYRQLMELQGAISLRRNATLLGTVQEAMVDEPFGRDGTSFVGRLKSQAPEIDGLVKLRGKDLQPGEVVLARVVKAGPYQLEAKVVEKKILTNKTTGVD